MIFSELFLNLFWYLAILCIALFCGLAGLLLCGAYLFCVIVSRDGRSIQDLACGRLPPFASGGASYCFWYQVCGCVMCALRCWAMPRKGEFSLLNGAVYLVVSTANGEFAVRQKCSSMLSALLRDYVDEWNERNGMVERVP